MMMLSIRAVHLIVSRACRHVRLTSQNGLDAFFLGGFIKFDQTVHHPVIGHRHGGLSQFLDTTKQSVQTAGAVQQTVLTMHVQMNEGHGLILLYKLSAISNTRCKR